MKTLVKVLLIILIIVWCAVGIVSAAQGLTGPNFTDTEEYVVQMGDTMYDIYYSYARNDITYQMWKADMYILNEDVANELRQGFWLAGQKVTLPIYQGGK